MLLALLDEDTVEPVAQILGQHHARYAGVDIFDRDEVREIAFGLDERDGLAARRRLLARARVVDEIAKLLGKLAMPAPRFIGRSLHRDRVKLLVVAFEMGLGQGNKMGGRRHGWIAFPAVPTNFMTNFRAALLR